MGSCHRFKIYGVTIWSVGIEISWLKVLQRTGNIRDASWQLEREITSCPLAAFPDVFGPLSDRLLNPYPPTFVFATCNPQEFRPYYNQSTIVDNVGLSKGFSELIGSRSEIQECLEHHRWFPFLAHQPSESLSWLLLSQMKTPSIRIARTARNQGFSFISQSHAPIKPGFAL